MNKIFRPMDGTVYMRLGCKVDHGARPVCRQKAGNQGSVCNVALNQRVPRIARQAGQRFGVAGVSEFVEVDDRLAGLGQPVQHKVSADEAGAAGDENGHG